MAGEQTSKDEALSGTVEGALLEFFESKIADSISISKFREIFPPSYQQKGLARRLQKMYSKQRQKLNARVKANISERYGITARRRVEALAAKNKKKPGSLPFIVALMREKKNEVEVKQAELGLEIALLEDQLSVLQKSLDKTNRSVSKRDPVEPISTSLQRSIQQSLADIQSLISS
eukprot:TRINITY_DN18262_c0_g1_i1.p1 TRINITY_DN18262_c0_g1~~TRINITY_DN18262_c0_g1_i1.p1  ORF type:complete len:176 (-),score=32.77 TRINITY_DN18262_c0_g1_i1:387-914(-)